jgi:hypothetical protein
MRNHVGHQDEPIMSKLTVVLTSIVFDGGCNNKFDLTDTEYCRVTESGSTPVLSPPAAPVQQK